MRSSKKGSERHTLAKTGDGSFPSTGAEGQPEDGKGDHAQARDLPQADRYCAGGNAGATRPAETGRDDDDLRGS